MSQAPFADSRQPVALTIAGSDSSGGAGIQADLKTFTALGVYGATAVTAITAQNTLGVQGVAPVTADFVLRQMESVLADLRVTAIKTGMLANASIVRAVAGRLVGLPGVPVVVDPVMVATSGDQLLTPDAIEVFRDRLLPLAALVTPNLAEAARLLGVPAAKTVDEAVQQAHALMGAGCRAVLLKGGHGEGDELADILCDADGTTVFRHRRIATRNLHGTGCTLSAAITAHLAMQVPVRSAVGKAIEFLLLALQAGASRDTGKGHGPVDHLFALR